MNAIEEKINKQIIEDFEYIKNLRRYFHKNPEVSKEEFKTALKIEEELDKLNICHKRVGQTGVYAELTGDLKGDKIILLRADIDALYIEEEHECEYKSENKGVMHACGHDAHTASLLGAIRVLNKNKHLFGGTIRFIFQQAEEIGYGANVFIKEGYVKGAERSFGIHVASDVEVGSIVLMEGANNASVDWFKIKVKGLSSHVSSPEKGVDAIYIASQIIVALQALITRKTNPMDHVLIGVGKITAGTSYNIVAQNAEIEGTIRVFSPSLREKMKNELEALANSIAYIYGGSVEVEWKDFTSPLINDKDATLEAQEVANSLFGKDKVIKHRTPSLSGDDMAEIILNVPGVYAYVGSKNSNVQETTVAHHNPNFDIDENCLVIGSSMYACYAIDFLNK